MTNIGAQHPVRIIGVGNLFRGDDAAGVLAARRLKALVGDRAEVIEAELAGLDVLFDDREESPGVKFNDTDLIGLPIRLTVSERSLKEGGVELKLRHQADRRIVKMADTVREVVKIVGELLAEIETKVVPVPYED